MILGLILARGGSKRIPRKNIRVLGDYPLIVWTIVEAKDCDSLDRLVVSSDDNEILELAEEYGVETLRRPPWYATDDSTPYQSIIHALDCLDEEFTHVCLLQPTSPFRTGHDIDRTISFCHGRNAVASREFRKSVPNGAVYVGRTNWLRGGGNFDDPEVRPFYMPPSRSLDIDTEEDWTKAEAML